VLFLEMAHGTQQSEVWRALNGAATLQAQCGKIIVAVSEDIDARNTDAVFWSLAYRFDPIADTLLLPHKAGGHGPKAANKSEAHGSESSILMDATLKAPTSPLALPAKKYMERSRQLWEELGLPRIPPAQPPWHGYDLGDWAPDWQTFADNAAKGDWVANGLNTFARRKGGLKPETPVRNVEKAGKP
jgi:hypothetical protein